MDLYIVYKYEVEEIVDINNRNKKHNHGPIIIGLFRNIPEMYSRYKNKKISLSDTELSGNNYNDEYYILFSVDLINEGSLKVYQAFADLISLTTADLKENCYAIMKLKITQNNFIYPYGQVSICWTPKYLFFQNLFISNNLAQLVRLENMIKNGENIYEHELINLHPQIYNL